MRTPEVPRSTWAPELVGHTPEAPPLPRSRRGRLGGRAVVEATRSGDRVEITIRYRDFRDRRGWTIDGEESITNTGGPFGSMTYSADLRVSGRHRGRLHAENVAGNLSAFSGTLTSRLDGVRMTMALDDP